jgi:phasin family protein
MAEAKTARKTVSKPAKAKAAPAPAVALVAETPAVPAPVALPKSKDPVMNAEALAKPFEAVAPAMEKVAADIVAQTQAAQEQMSAKVKDMMEKNMKSMTEMTEFAKGNVEALIESAKAAAAGAETLTTHFVETSKKSAEEAQAAFKTMTAAKTPNELMAAQNEFARAQFDKAVANMSHFSETWLKLAGDVVQPISSRMAVAAETVKKSIAA